MALRLRRGTDAERLIMTPPEAGELIYTTDTKAVWVGDGTTVGGLPVSGAALNIDDLGNVVVVAPNPGDVIQYDGTQWINAPSPDKTGNVYGEDSTLLVDTDNSVIVGPIVTDTAIVGDLIGDVTGNADGDHTGTFTGSVTGNVIGNVVGTLDGDITGSVFADNSSIVIDGITGDVHTDVIRTPILQIKTDISGQPVNLNIDTLNETSEFRLLRSAAADISGDAIQYGRILFGRNDISGIVETASISGYQDGFALSHDTNGTHTSPSLNMFVKDGQFAFGTFAPATNAKVDVAGNLHVTDGYTQFGSLTTTERNALTAANGMVIYNTTNNKFEGYQSGGWINLDDGTAAS